MALGLWRPSRAEAANLTDPSTGFPQCDLFYGATIRDDTLMTTGSNGLAINGGTPLSQATHAISVRNWRSPRQIAVDRSFAIIMHRELWGLPEKRRLHRAVNARSASTSTSKYDVRSDTADSGRPCTSNHDATPHTPLGFTHPGTPLVPGNHADIWREYSPRVSPSGTGAGSGCVITA